MPESHFYEYLSKGNWVCGSLQEKIKHKPEQEKYLIEMFKKGSYYCSGFNDVVSDPSFLTKCHDVTLPDLERLLKDADTETTRRWLANIEKQKKNCIRSGKIMLHDQHMAEFKSYPSNIMLWGEKYVIVLHN